MLCGLLLTWLLLYAYSHMDLPAISDGASRGCRELGECPVSWWEGGLLLAYLLAPAFIFGSINAIAYKSWSRKKWAIALSIGAMFASILYLEPYATRLLQPHA